MFDPGYDATIVQRGIDEARACRDMLTPVPPRPGRADRLRARLLAVWSLLRQPRLVRNDSPAMRPTVARLWR